MIRQSIPGKRIFVLSFAILLALSIFECSQSKKETEKKVDSVVYIGTYTSGESEGIYVYRLDGASGALTELAPATRSDNPNFLAIHPDRGYLYSVNRNSTSKGFVSAFRIDPQDHSLAFINSQSSEGAGPCHVQVDRTGRWAMAVNYGSGSVCVLPIKKDGSLGPATDVKQHTGSSVNPRRQREAHPHSIWLSPDNRFAFVPDLGMDRIMIYKFDAQSGILQPHEPPYFATAPGAGPRHFAFHPDGRYAFVINELNSTITSMKYDSTSGSLTRVQTVRTLPENFTGENYCADVHVSSDGQFVYGSNRGHDSIAVFSFDVTSGTLSPIEYESTQGHWPRNFAIDPAGRILLVANQRSDNVVTYWIDQATGTLTPTGHQARIPTPVCLQLIPLEQRFLEGK